MDVKTLGKKLLYPHFAITLMLLPIATFLLVYSMVVLGTNSVISYIAYALSAYTLTIWCFRIPFLIRFFKSFKEENKYARRWLTDAHLRVNVSLYGTLLWNAGYAIFQLCLGFYHRSFWYHSLAGYYVSLAVMRFFLVRYTRKHKPGEKMKAELIRYRACGIVFLVMNLAISLIIFFMVYWNRTFRHHEITTIAMAAFTFGSLAMAIVNVVKYRKYGSPVYSASKAIALASACVSMLTLESTMLTTFNDGSLSLTARRIFLGVSGGVVSIFIIGMSVYMIAQSNQKLTGTYQEKKEHPNGNT